MQLGDASEGHEVGPDEIDQEVKALPCMPDDPNLIPRIHTEVEENQVEEK